MCYESVDDCLAALKFIPDWFVSSKMNKNLFTALYADGNIIYFNENPCDVLFSCNEMCILNIDLNKINPDDNNYNEDDPDTIISFRLFACKAPKKELVEELMLMTCHPRRWWNFYMPEDDKK